MFVLHANKTSIDVLEKEVVTTGSVNVYQCKISFSEDWDNLIKTAVFKVGSDSKSVLLPDVATDEETGQQFTYCTIPAKILDEYNRTLYIGLYGVFGDEIVLPTIWQSLGTVREGVIIEDLVDGGSDGIGVHDQILAELSRKGDSLDYDRTSSTLTLKSGETILSAVTIVEGTGLPGEGDGEGEGGTTTTTGVTSFNGRTGAVTPQKGDYTAEMVGADPLGTAKEQVTTLREEVDNRLDDKISSTGGTMTAPLGFEVANEEPSASRSSRVATTSNNPTGSISMQEDGLLLESSNKAIGFAGSSLKDIGVAIEDNDAVPFKQMQEHTQQIVETAVENVEIPTKVSELQNDAGYATETYVDEVLSGIEGGGGVVGPAGKDGKSAYEIAVENGFVGSETDWLESLKGEHGEPGETGQPGERGEPGEDGFSPTVTTKLNDAKDGVVVTITDVDGDHTFTVLNGLDGLDGKDGANGENGQDGFSPVVNIAPNETGDGTVVTIEDASGEKTFEVLNGRDGEEGPNGKSAYEIAVDNGFEGTEQEWLDSLKVRETENGLPTGGTKGQVLAKSSDEDFDTQWETLNGDSFLVRAPTGTIVIWSGTKENIPKGWYLCDGNNGTPDLRDRFVLGAGGKYAVDNVGGEKTHTLTVDEMPQHRHEINEKGVDVTTNGAKIAPAVNLSTTKYYTEYAGGSQPHNNMPPYYALCYIMKLEKDESDIVYQEGEGITIQDETISVTTPTIPVTKEEYNALTDEERKDKLYVITDVTISPAPYIEEYDTDDGWHVRKWSSGYVEMLYDVSIPEPGWVVTRGILYANIIPDGVSLPVTLTKRYSVSGSVGMLGGGLGLFLAWDATRQNPLTHSPNVIAVAKESSYTGGFVGNVVITGRWK